MKILLSTTAITLNGGGIASYNNELANTLHCGNEFDLLTTENIDSYKGFEHVYSLYRINLKSAKDYANLIVLFNNNHYDLIINSDSSVISVIAPFLKAPIVTVSHTFNNMPAIEAGYNSKYVQRIIALSVAGKGFLDSYFNIEDSKKVVSLYNFVQHKVEFSDSKSTNKCLNIVFPGGASMMKYPEMILGAVNRLVKTDLNFKFFWLGNLRLPLAGLSLPKTIDQLAQKDKRVVFTGRIPRHEAQKIYDEANVFLLPSRAEGCPVSLVEAMCSGCIPIVGSAKHVCREILDDGEFGIVVKQGSSEELYNALVDVITNHDKYLYNYKKTYEYSMNKLSASVWRTRMIEIFTDALACQKQYIPFSKLSFYKSYYIFKYHERKLLLKDRILSLKGYFKFNFLYLTR